MQLHGSSRITNGRISIAIEGICHAHGCGESVLVVVIVGTPTRITARRGDMHTLAHSSVVAVAAQLRHQRGRHIYRSIVPAVSKARGMRTNITNKGSSLVTTVHGATSCDRC
jgi:hypothetical protein